MGKGLLCIDHNKAEKEKKRPNNLLVPNTLCYIGSTGEMNIKLIMKS